VILVVVTVLGLAADLWSKHWAFGSLAERLTGQAIDIDRKAVFAGQHGALIQDHQPLVIIPTLLEFKLVLNVGAVFGAGEGKRPLFIGVTVFAVLFGTLLFGWWTRARDKWAHVAIGLLLAGGLGNLYDRWFFGCVRDFIHPFPGLRLSSGGHSLWPYVSNVADKFLLIGIAILLVHAWRTGTTEVKKQS